MANSTSSVQKDVPAVRAQDQFEFKRLHKEHQRIEEQLRRFDNQKFLSAEQELYRKQLQKKKLLGKDRMQEILKANLSHQVYV